MADDYGPESKWAGLKKPKPYGCTGCFKAWSRLDDFEAHVCDGKAQKEAQADYKKQREEAAQKLVQDSVSTVLEAVRDLQLENINLKAQLAAKDTEIEHLKRELRSWIFISGGDVDEPSTQPKPTKKRCRYPENGGGGHVEYCANFVPCLEHGRT